MTVDFHVPDCGLCGGEGHSDHECPTWRPAANTPDAVLQLSFPDLVPSPAGTSLLSISERFARFHADNPHIYRALRGLALDMVRRGHERVGIGMCFEVLRWSAMRTRGDDSYKLNNDYRALFARMLADNEPELATAFEFRRLRAES